MDSFKEFEGKNLDEAISEACAYFDAPREKLEIDIVQDSKSGIFGLVGARKAKVRARRVQLRTAVEDILGRKNGQNADARDEDETAKSPRGKKRGQARSEEKSEEKSGEKSAEKSADRGGHKSGEKAADRPADRQEERRPRQERTGARSEKGPEKGSEKGTERGSARGADRNFDKKDRKEYADPDLQPAVLAVGLDEPEVEDDPARDQARYDEQVAREERAARQQERNELRRPRLAPRGASGAGRRNEKQPEGRNRPKSQPRPQEATTFHGDAFGEEAMQEDGDDLQRIPFAELDQDRLCTLSQEVVGRLVEPIVGTLPLTVELQDGRVNVRMDCGEDSGLLIGREGQTLASLQYLASRMVSRGMNAAVRVQLDAGEYRLRQDEKLREMALSLAEKVRATGKSHSTRPLSSYHRRIVHLVLQESEDVQTRSSGDGPLKRVVIQRKRA